MASVKMTASWVVAMKAASTSEMSVNMYQTAKCNNPEDCYLQPPYCCANIRKETSRLCVYTNFKHN
jgi:hypothetical protein